MTADTALDHAVNAVRHGATDFLVKPFSMDALDAALSRVHGGAKLSLAPPPGMPRRAPHRQSWRAALRARHPGQRSLA